MWQDHRKSSHMSAICNFVGFYVTMLHQFLHQKWNIFISFLVTYILCALKPMKNKNVQHLMCCNSKSGFISSDSLSLILHINPIYIDSILSILLMGGRVGARVVRSPFTIAARVQIPVGARVVCEFGCRSILVRF